MALTMLPTSELLTAPTGGRILPDGRAVPELRARLRRIPSARNALAVASCWTQTIAIAVAAVWLDHPVTWILAFVLMGRAHAQLAALMHEAAHRTLFRNRRLNDWVGRWLVGYPAFVPTDAYRRAHMAHHREEFGPNEPDLALYVGYPITRASLRRKLWRDATGRTGLKLLRAQARGLWAPEAKVRRVTWSILGVQALLLATCWLLGHPWVYLVLWFLPYLTAWRVINRLRSIAEHGGMVASPDRRLTTHSVVQHPLARFLLVPYHIGWHLAHHCDAGVPWRNLPRYHRELRASGYVTPGLEYPTYPALWRKLSSRPS
ncbi:MAG: fatty acid desaturase family protein [Acidimicrobiales bacterium]|nr:fatty acid desaturase family protein [Acidimicrobiales bacterium]